VNLAPRVAFFPCAFNEVDGMANTARHFEAYSRRKGLPFLNVHGGYENYIRWEGSVISVERKRGWPKFPLDKKHDFDLYFWRHYKKVKRIVQHFRPDVLHITGPSDVGMLGALVADKLRVPLVASWHTNLHEYAERRALSLLRILPGGVQLRAGKAIEGLSLRLLARYYRIPRVLLAPNPELIAMLEQMTGKPCFPMGRGVNLDLFNPGRRDRPEGPFVIGYVGRITVEKNISLLAEIEQELLARGRGGFQFLIVGQGADEPLLRDSLRNAVFTGVLQGEALARAYANMDVFLFPSRTDTFGNVVLEALASGVPALVTDAGGPKFIVRHGQSGFVAASVAQFVDRIGWMQDYPSDRQAMARAARTQALGASWDNVFDGVYDVYRRLLEGDLRSYRSSLPPGRKLLVRGLLIGPEVGNG
jgi:glycosyltransferase involved in cell wall biosynthesis